MSKWIGYLPDFYAASPQIAALQGALEQQTEARGRNAFDILYDRICGGNAVSDITRMEYTHRLLERRSTAPFRQTQQEKS